MQRRPHFEAGAFERVLRIPLPTDVPVGNPRVKDILARDDCLRDIAFNGRIAAEEVATVHTVDENPAASDGAVELQKEYVPL